MRRIALVLVGGMLAAGAITQACSGDNANTDGGADATSNDVVATDVATDSPKADAPSNDCPTYTGSSDLCKAAVTHCQACGGFTGTSCDKAHFAEECEGFAALYSTQCTNEIVAAASNCDAAVSCTFTSFLDASLTTGQAKAANDYCAKCGDGGSCETNLAANVGLALYSDTVCNLIDTACTPDASTASACKLSTYQACAFGVAAANAPKNPCSDAGTD